MADRRQRDSSGTSGGTDVEPLRSGMKEEDRKRGSASPERLRYPGEEHERETSARKDPPSPYHDISVGEGGLAPRARPGEGTPPPPSPRELGVSADRKIGEERGDHENEAGNAPRTDPAARGAGE